MPSTGPFIWPSPRKPWRSQLVLCEALPGPVWQNGTETSMVYPFWAGTPFGDVSITVVCYTSGIEKLL